MVQTDPAGGAVYVRFSPIQDEVTPPDVNKVVRIISNTGQKCRRECSKGGKTLFGARCPPGCVFFFSPPHDLFIWKDCGCLSSPAGHTSQKPCEVKVASADPSSRQQWFAVAEHLQLL